MGFLHTMCSSLYPEGVDRVLGRDYLAGTVLVDLDRAPPEFAMKMQCHGENIVL